MESWNFEGLILLRHVTDKVHKLQNVQKKRQSRTRNRVLGEFRFSRNWEAKHRQRYRLSDVRKS